MSPLVTELFARIHDLDLARANVAQRAGVCEATVEKWETGGRDPRLSLVQLVGQTLGLELRWVEVGRPLVKPRRKLTPEAIREIVRLYRAGAKLASISCDTGVSRQTISRVVANYARDECRRRRPTPLQIAEIPDLYAQGLSNGAIARKLGISRDSVRRYLCGAGRAA